MSRKYLGTSAVKQAQLSTLGDVQRATQDAWGVPIGTGALHDSPLDEGGDWTVSGPGQSYVVRNPSGYAVNPETNPSNQNSYVFVSASGKVRRFVSAWSGGTGSFATMAISTEAGSLENMLHINMVPSDKPVIAKQIEGGGIIGVAYAGFTSDVPAIDDDAEHFAVLELVDDKVFVFVDGLLRAWGQDAQIATWGDSLQHCMAQLHNSTEKLYGMWTFTEVETRSDLMNTMPVAEFLHQRTPIQTATFFQGPEGTEQLADFDIVAGEGRDQVFRSAFGLVQHQKAGSGYSVRHYYGNGGYVFGSTTDTYMDWSTSILGFRWTVGGGTRLSLPHWAFGYGDGPVVPELTVGPESSTSPRLVQADDLASLPARPDGSIGMTKDGKFAQRVSGVWVEKGTGGGGGGESIGAAYPMAVNGSPQVVGYAPACGPVDGLSNEIVASGVETTLKWTGSDNFGIGIADGDEDVSLFLPETLTGALYEISVYFIAEVTAGAGSVVIKLYRNGTALPLLYSGAIGVQYPAFTASKTLRIAPDDVFKVTATVVSASGTRTIYDACQLSFKFVGDAF